jgi:sugar phosphate permease
VSHDAGTGEAARTLRLVVWTVTATTYCTMIVARTGPSIAADQISAAFGIPAVALGALFGAQYFTYMLLQLPSGALADSVGPRWMLGLGALLGGLGTLLFATTHSYHIATAGRVMLGVGDAFIYLNGLRLIGNWFRPQEYATWLGLLGVAGGIGSLLATAPLALLLTRVGWRAGFVGVACALLLSSIACLAWVRSSPADVDPHRRHRSVREALPSPRRSFAAVLAVARNSRQWTVIAAHAALVGPSIAFFGVWAVPMLLQEYGLSRVSAGIFLMFATLGGLIGGPAIAYASDRLGARRPLLLACLVAATSCWIGVAVLGGRPPLWFLFVTATVTSVGAAGTVLAFAMAREVNPTSLTGTASGMVNVGGYLCGAVLQVVMGHALDSHWEGAILDGARVYTAGGFANAFSWVAVTCAVLTIVALRAPETGRWPRHSEGLEPTPDTP